LSKPWAGATLVDGLLACAQPEVVEAEAVGVLVHMPLTWQSGLTGSERIEVAEQEARALRASVPVIATSNWTARYLEQAYALDAITVATPGVEAADVVAGSDPPLVVQIATLAAHKDQLAVVNALAGCGDLPWRARLAGAVDREPDYVEQVRALIAQRGLTDRIEITGAIDREAAFAGADLLLLPSRAEAFGMVVTEGLARGIPAIVASGGPAEALDMDAQSDRPGVVVTPGDVAELCDALRRWLEDSDHRASLRSAALRRRESLTGWEVTARCLRDTLSTPR
jgi:glycosyltransferase involved in cell wall biosynthesis